MTMWEFVAIPCAHAPGFHWRWCARKRDGARAESERTFELYFDCVQDARRNGYAGAMPWPARNGAIGCETATAPRAGAASRRRRRARTESAE